MLEFWAAASVLMIVVSAMIVPVLLRPATAVTTDAAAEKRRLFIEQMQELEQDKINGLLDESQFLLARNELERRVLDEVESVPVPNVQAYQPDRRLAVVLIFLLPLTGVLLYLKLGHLEVFKKPVTTDAQHLTPENIVPLFSSLKNKLDENPDNGAAWVLLAKYYASAGRLNDAKLAYEKAAGLITNDANVLTDYADVLASVNGNNLTGKPEELIDQALKIDPHNGKALMLAATAAYDRKNYKKAIDYWQTLQKVLSADSPYLENVKAAIQDAYNMLGEKPPAQDLQNAASPTQAAAAMTGVSGMVRVAQALAEKVDPSATLFVFARATQGPPMPIAIIKVAARDLPYAYHLDDSNAVMPTQKLSQAGEVVLVARISKSGNAKPEAGDLQGVSAVVKPNGQSIDIEINEVIP